ncbi:MAG: RdgB/HAM1 family non-canonical purine NTP pyrophosphatase [Lachnospiraceae bacterium]|nr:RdgB/HAM1 family non-canonical purine NTP pyrophosphatase [Lachnospiraceae bacterium]
MEKKIVFATANEGKMREIRMILADLGMPVLSLKEAGLDVEIEENGKTFEENAEIKVRAIRPYTDAVILADDSGLEIDYLNGEPGVHSARYMGHDTPYEVKNANIIRLLDAAEGEERRAKYVCAIAVSFPDGKLSVVRGELAGEIARASAGAGGFGYDPIFYLPEYGKTAAQVDPELKNRISHRGKALEAVKKEILCYGEKAHEDTGRQ